MLPYELKEDKEGLLYIDGKELKHDIPLFLDHREFLHDRYYPCNYISIYSSNDYIIKNCVTVFTRKEIKEIKEMLKELIARQSLVPDVRFPIGYYKDRRKLSGLVVKYYKNAMSLCDLLDTPDLNELKKYYLHDEDNIRNLFFMLQDLLGLIYEMYNSGINYKGSYSDNVLLHENNVRVIDFKPSYVSFDHSDEEIKKIMYTYNRLLELVLKKYNLTQGLDEKLKDFDHAKTYMIKLENKVRKG